MTRQTIRTSASRTPGRTLGRAFVLAAGLTGLLAGALAAATAFTGATVHPVSGPSLENATILVENGKILALGTDVVIPAGTETVDLAGLHLYPGFVHPLSALGLTEVGAVRATRDHTETGDVNSNIRAEIAFHADSELLPVALSGGILTAHVAPRGGVFRGTSAVMALEGWNFEDMTLRSGVGMHLSWPMSRPPANAFNPPSDEEIKERKEKALKTINDTLDNAKAYEKALSAFAAGSSAKPDFDPRLAALVGVVRGEQPLFLHADEKSQIEDALDWLQEREITAAVLVTGPDAAYLGDRLAEMDVSVLLNGVHRRPERAWEPYDVAYTAAKRLHDAGVRFAIGDGASTFDAAHVRNLPFHAAMAAAHGLPKDIALRSVTLSSAELLSVDDRVGSLEPGKDATFIATNGDPLEVRTQILGAWIAGQKVDFDNDRQKRLYRKYNNRPRAEDALKEPTVEGLADPDKG